MGGREYMAIRGERRGGDRNFGWEIKAKETISSNLVNTGVLLKWIFRKINTGTRGGMLWKQYQTFNFHKTWTISWLADQHLATEAELPVDLAPNLQTASYRNRPPGRPSTHLANR
jgi:hypothetical protein